MTSLENRNSSALFKRAEQLKRWSESDTNTQPSEPKRKSQRIQFTDGCVFLAACAASDKEEVDRLLKRGADIDTANIDGLTALHQACIDDNLEMVEYLVERKADVNRGDNEGWTPLHATASCGFLSIAKFLLEQGANVSAVNNDGELAIDISESDEMEELLQKEIDKQGINCDESRNTEERLMLEDVQSWKNSKVFGDVPHIKTGATALHVAAAKGYIKVIGLLIQAGAPVNAQDFDGWTPLHAAAHWAQREACDVLCDNYANMDIKNYVGQTCFDVADPDVLRLLEELKKKQATLQKDRPDLRIYFNRPPVPSSHSGGGGKRSQTSSTGAISTPMSNAIFNNVADNANESSITRLSVDDKAQRSKEESERERNLLLHKTIEERKAELESPDVESKPLIKDSNHPDHSSPSIPAKAPGYSPPHLDERTPRKTLTVVNAEGELEEIHPWRRPASLRVRPTFNSEYSGSHSGNSNKLSPAGIKEEDDVQLRRVHSFESDEKFYAKLTELRNRIKNNTSTTGTGNTTTTNITNSTVPAAALRSLSTSKPLSNTITSLTSSNNNNESQQLSSVAEVSSHDSLSPNEDTSLSSTTSSTNSSDASWSASRKKREDHVGNRPKSEPPKQQPSQVRSSPNSLSSENNNVEVNFNIHVMATTGIDEVSKTMQTGPVMTITSTTVDPEINTVNNNGHTNTNGVMTNAQQSAMSNMFKQFFKSFVPPVRDEESETQRKAHAKRVRETRRSTQGVTLEDLKSAEQLVKKKQQQENQQRTSELQQLVASQQQKSSPTPPTVSTVASSHTGPVSSSTSTSVTAVSTSASIAAAAAAVTSGSTSSLASNASLSGDSERHERRPSWRLRLDANDKTKFRLEEDTIAAATSRGNNKNQNNALTALARKGSKYESTRSDLTSPTIPEHSEVPSVTITSSTNNTATTSTSASASTSSSSSTLQPSNHRRKKPKRRSTGVVNLDVDDVDPDGESAEEESSSVSNYSKNRTQK